MKSRVIPNYLLILGAVFLLFVSCDTFFDNNDDDDDDDNNDSGAPLERDFWAYDWTTESSYICSAVKMAEGAHCIVYVEDGEETAAVDAATAKRIARTFSSIIYPQITDAFGLPLDVDDNGKVILLLLDIRDGYNPQTSLGHTGGYFYPADMEAASSYEPHPNLADMIYIDTYPTSAGSASSLGTVAHEFQHLINYSNRRGVGKSAMDIWIDEGLSSAAEYIYGGPQYSRILWLANERNFSYPQGNNFFVWNGIWENDEAMAAQGSQADPYTNYSTVYLFFQWLRIHASNETEIYKEIINSPYGDYRAVTAAAVARIGSEFSSWETLLKTWFAANILQHSSGYYGYKGAGEITVPIRYFEAGGSNIDLFPGEGVFSKLDNSWNSSASSGDGPDIRYAGFNYTTKELMPGPVYVQDNFLLTFNSNSNTLGGHESGYLASAGGTLKIEFLRKADPLNQISRSAVSGGENQVPNLYEWDGARVFLEKRDKAKRNPAP
jgi:hypothetical protein